MNYVERPLYLDRIRPFAKNGNAKIITGIRRSGKSTMLKELDRITDGRILVINMELWRNRKFKDPDILYEYIHGSIADGIKVVAIDEIQDIDHWQDLVRSLIAEGNCDLYITGSNSRLLSGEFGSLLTGRYNLFDNFTLTYSECARFAEAYLEKDMDVFSRFLHVGGFPSVWRNNYAESDAFSEIRDILYSIQMHDIVSRYDVKRSDLLERIFRFICDNVGSRVSVNNIFKVLHNEDMKLSKDHVYEYISYLESACLIYKAKMYDVKGKKILTATYKYYLADIGLKNAAYGFRSEDIGGYVENILYLEMRARGYDVWLGDYSGKEVDFVCMKGKDIIYVQATTRLSGEDVVRREFGNLRDIPDNHKKYVVVLEKSPLDSDLDGIICVTLEDFLKNKL